MVDSRQHEVTRGQVRGFWEVARTPRMVTVFLLLAAAAVVCGLLGSWQLGRAELRGAQAAEEARQEVLGAPPRPIGALLAPGEGFRGDLVGRRAVATGVLTGRQLLVTGRVHQGAQGYLVLAEMRVLDDGAGTVHPDTQEAPVLAVVRGWVPDATAPLPPVPEGTTTVTGYLQSAEAAGSNRAPDGTRLPEGQTDAISVAQLAGTWGTPIYTGYLVQSEPAPVAPLAQLDPPTLPGSGMALRNLMYALEWWIFGGFALAIWVRSVRDEARASREDELAAEDGAPGEALQD